MQDQLLAPTFLFRYSIPCSYRKEIGVDESNQLEPTNALPSFGELEGRLIFADVRAAWNESGLSFSVQVARKGQPPWCRESRLDDSDGLHVWIDTRDTHNIHRATRFCHRFVFLPAGGGQRMDQPVGDILTIDRAREHPAPPARNCLKVRSEQRVDGYFLQALIPGEALTGFDPAEHPRLGFTYAVVDREIGWQTLSVGPEFPITNDPSLWGTLELVKD